jgi:hypothetical protein
VKYLVTALWHDGLANEEEHPTWEAAQDFIGEAMGCEGIVSVKVEKLKSFGERASKDYAVGKATNGSDYVEDVFTAPDGWDGSQPLT